MTSEWYVNKIWGNMESVQQFQQDLGKLTIDFIRKQQDLLTTIQQNYGQLEDAAKNFLEKLLEIVKVHDEEISDVWDKNLVEIAAIIEKNNEAALQFFENSQQKIYEFINMILNEQQKLQNEIVQKFMKQEWDFFYRSAS